MCADSLNPGLWSAGQKPISMGHNFDPVAERQRSQEISQQVPSAPLKPWRVMPDTGVPLRQRDIGPASDMIEDQRNDNDLDRYARRFKSYYGF